MSDDADRLVWEFDEQFAIPLAGEQPNLADPVFQSRVLEMLSTQVRISQWLRLGEYVLLNFREEVPEGGVQEGNFLIPPRPLIDAYVAVPGPIDGPFTRPIAHAFMEVIAAICTFALGRPVNLPPTLRQVAGHHPAGVRFAGARAGTATARRPSRCLARPSSWKDARAGASGLGYSARQRNSHRIRYARAHPRELRCHSASGERDRGDQRAARNSLPVQLCCGRARTGIC